MVLQRKRNESIMIGDDVKIIVVDVRGDKVRLGIEAPASVAVHRQEVYETIHHSQASLCSHEFPKGACRHEDCEHYKGGD